MSDRHAISPYPIRMPHELRQALEETAKSGSRSLHAEIIARLERSFEGDALGLDKDVLDVLALQSTLTLVLLDGLDTSSLTSIQLTAANALHQVAKSMSEKLVLNKGSAGHTFGTLPASHPDHPEHPDFEPSKK